MSRARRCGGCTPGCRRSVLLVIDAAYAEFVQRNDYEPGIELVDAAENVVMTRTFSKIYALAGLRLGWVYCSPRVADVLEPRARAVQCVLAGAGRGHCRGRGCRPPSTARASTTTCGGRGSSASCRALGLELSPGVANFVLVRFPAGTARCRRGLRVPALARHPHPQGRGLWLPEHLRITVGTEDEMRAVAAALRRFRERGMSDLAIRPRRAHRRRPHRLFAGARAAPRRAAPARSSPATRRQETLDTARSLGLADDYTLDPAEAARGADLVVIAAPHSA